MGRTSAGMINMKPTFAAVLDKCVYCRIPCVFELFVCLKLSLTLDGFINDLYKQGTFWFNVCLNASFIICILFSVQLLLFEASNRVAIWTTGIII